MTSRLIRVLATGILIAMLAAGAAVADGDPASDTLLGENVFYPYTPPVTAALQKQLNAETAAASRAHFPIKVALIASPVDLGVIPELFDRAQSYAAFLDQEISFQGKQMVLVVMPSGYGVQGVTRAVKIAVTSLHKPTGRHSNDLALAAIIAVAKLAAAAGHPLKPIPPNGGSTSGSGDGSTPLLLVLLVIGALGTAAGLVLVRRRQATRR